jgi:phage terminase large subunit-like protein
LLCGETLTYPVAWFSPTYKMLIDVWREANIVFNPIMKRRSVQERRLEFITGGVLDFWSLDKPDAARGRKYKRVIVDEAAMVPNLMEAWQHVIRPSLADYVGDGWLFSTPKGHNAFWQMHQWGQDPELSEWASWTIPTSANPFIADSEIEAMRATMPELIYQQEILAQFVDDAGGIFRRVMEAATAVELDKPIETRQYVAGVDVAQKVDFTVASVLDVESREMVYMDRFNRVEYPVLEDRLHAIYQRFNMAAMTIEDNSIGQGVIDHLRQRGMNIIPFHTSNTTKQAIIQGLAAAFEHGEIKILNDPILIGELQAFEGKRLAGGSFSYSAPEGLHDDTVMSLAIAWQGIAKTGSVVLW